MRTHVLAILLLVSAPAIGAAPLAWAQVPDTLAGRRVPSDVAREVIDAFNATGTLRGTGPMEIAADREVTGDVAVLDGTLTIAGRITGRVYAINGDIALLPGAHVTGGILVVGGEVTGREGATVDGDIRAYRDRLDVLHEGDHVIARGQGTNDEDERWWRRQQRWRHQSYSDLRLFSARTYNRVEGLPIYLGPSLVHRFDAGRLDVDLYGIFRTGQDLSWRGDNLGHDVKTELRLESGIAFGGRLFDVVEPTEKWRLTDTEVGLASFFLHRDYRDYWNRHGALASVTLFLGRDANLTTSLSDERWSARQTLDPFTLFRNDAAWRLNPLMDEGRFHLLSATLKIDTRDNRSSPWSGWLVMADYERGTGHTTSFGPTSPGVRPVIATPSAATTYDRGFVDVRRYNRLTREAQLDVRVVAGGWLGGDALPLQRRFALDGPGGIPGFDSRRPEAGQTDALSCSTFGTPPGGIPAQCDRMILAQAEYRGDLLFGLLDNWSDPWHAEGWGRGEAKWVLFADAGRGWLVGPAGDGLHYGSGALPGLGTWRTDAGIGITFNDVGLYVAKALSDSKEPANVFVRIKRRF